MKVTYDHIIVHKGKKTFKGVIVSISFDHILVHIKEEEEDIKFDTIDGESEEGYSIDLTDIDIPENMFKYLKNKINNEGFHYCFSKYSDWKEIKDEEFQKLKTEYLNIAKKLEKYIEDKANLF